MAGLQTSWSLQNELRRKHHQLLMLDLKTQVVDPLNGFIQLKVKVTLPLDLSRINPSTGIVPYSLIFFLPPLIPPWRNKHLDKSWKHLQVISKPSSDDWYLQRHVVAVPFLTHSAGCSVVSHAIGTRMVCYTCDGVHGTLLLGGRTKAWRHKLESLHICRASSTSSTGACLFKITCP